MREISLANNRFDLIKINSLYIELMLLIKIEKKTVRNYYIQIYRLIFG